MLNKALLKSFADVPFTHNSPLVQWI